MSLGTQAGGADITLSADQQHAIDTCMAAARASRQDRQGRLLFVTGNAGTGKSTVLNRLRSQCTVIVLAPTGLAAINVGGVTIHRFFRYSPGVITRSKAKALDKFKEAVLRRADIIAVDEISMVRCDLFDGINWSLQKTLRTDEPFGGKCVVAIGDMMQLEPVVSDRDREWITAKYRSHFWFDSLATGGSARDELAIESGKTITPEVIQLRQVFRQADQEFVGALNAIREGDVSGIAYLNQRSRVSAPANNMYVSLTFGRKKAEAINESRLHMLASDCRTFTAAVEGQFEPDDVPVATEITLKVGAQVMVAKNIIDQDGGSIANGEVGEVIGFVRDLPVVQLASGRVVTIGREKWARITYAMDLEKDTVVESEEGSFVQIPLKLAWAITTHKAQGQTLEAATLEMEMPAFAHGQLYVALSRVKSPQGLYLRRRLSTRDLVIHDRVREWLGLPQPGRVKAEAFTGAA